MGLEPTARPPSFKAVALPTEPPWQLSWLGSNHTSYTRQSVKLVLINRVTRTHFQGTHHVNLVRFFLTQITTYRPLSQNVYKVQHIPNNYTSLYVVHVCMYIHTHTSTVNLTQRAYYIQFSCNANLSWFTFYWLICTYKGLTPAGP